MTPPASSPRSRPSAGRIVELDALRGLSALAVGLYHHSYYVSHMVPGAPSAAYGLWWGCYGVQLFFAISGFVILGTLERTGDLRRFARARMTRLFPEYWAAMAVTAALAGLLGPANLRVDPLTWVFNLPMAQFWTRTPMVDGVYWSLNAELGFYVTIALAWRWRLTRRVEEAVLGWLALKWLFWALPFPPVLSLFLVTEQAAYFAVGLLAWRVWTGERRWRQQLPVLVAVYAVVLTIDPVQTHWLFPGLAGLLLLLATGRLRWLAHPVLLWMGWVSYPFYLLHAVIGYGIIARLEAIGVGPWPAALAATATTGLLAAAMATLFDRWRARPAPSRLPEREPAPA